MIVLDLAVGRNALRRYGFDLFCWGTACRAITITYFMVGAIHVNDPASAKNCLYGY